MITLHPADELETLWHVTVLSNFARGYDKYARVYSKADIPESTFPDRFFLLRESELDALNSMPPRSDCWRPDSRSCCTP